VDDGGLVFIYGNTYVWMEGIPRGTYTGPSSENLPFPIRATFYYPWYPETWKVNGQMAHYIPKLGLYSSSDSHIVENHIEQLEYGNIDLSIASWWGPGTNLDRARLSLLMDKTIALKSSVKWSVYYEDEMNENPNPARLGEDLDYLKKWFAWHSAWAHIDGRPVIFVYNDHEGCELADRWHQASKGEWYVVLKVFPGFEHCPNQPDSWHQYGPADAVIRGQDYFCVSPGFWKADESPMLPRVDNSTWHRNVRDMVSSNADWQLITTFNEAGEGTLIEAADAWESDSDYGFYLDALHYCLDPVNCYDSHLRLAQN
jgi:hypothetical protein